MDDFLKLVNLNFLGSGMHKISAEKFLDSTGILFLDVRDEQEVKLLRFNFDLFGIDTLTIPVNELPDRLNELPSDKLIACFCSSGTRSAWAYAYLASKGYSAKLLDSSNEELAAMLKPGRILKKLNEKQR